MKKLERKVRVEDMANINNNQNNDNGKKEYKKTKIWSTIYSGIVIVGYIMALCFLYSLLGCIMALCFSCL